MNAPTTKEAVVAAVTIVTALAEAIREVKEIPSGTLYANVMGLFSLGDYESAIGLLKRAGLVEESNHLLRWVGPEAVGT